MLTQDERRWLLKAVADNDVETINEIVSDGLDINVDMSEQGVSNITCCI